MLLRGEIKGERTGNIAKGMRERKSDDDIGHNYGERASIVILMVIQCTAVLYSVSEWLDGAGVTLYMVYTASNFGQQT